jgi:hypothetical protein
MTTATLSPASEKQVAFLTRLAGERDHDIPALHALIAQAEEGTIGKKSASLAIDILLGLPRKPIVHADGDALTEGYYSLNGDTYKIVKAKHSDNLYAKVLRAERECEGHADGPVMGEDFYCDGTCQPARASWEYVPGGMRVMAGATRLTVEEAAERGHLLGCCVICAKTLTTPQSVALGIGPVCRKRLG